MKKSRASKAWQGPEETPRIFYFLLSILAVALPLIALPHILEDVFDLPKATLLWVVSLLLAGFWLVRILYQGEAGWRKSVFDFPLAAFSAVAILATVFSYSTTSSLLSAVYKRHETLPTWLAYFFLFFVASNFLKRPRQISVFLKVVVLASVAVSVYGILQHFGYDVFSYQVSNVDRFRSFSTFGNAVFLGSYLVLVVPLALSLVFAEEDRRIKPVWLLALVLALVTLVFTYTRGAWMGGVLALTFWVILVVPKKRLLTAERKKWLWFLSVALLLVILVIFSAERFFPIDISLKERIVTAFELKGSVASRLSIWRTTVKAVSLRPWLGWGPETQRLVDAPLREKFFVQLEGPSKIADRPHNQLLHVSYSFGILGLLAYLWIMATFFFFSFSRLRKAKDMNFFLAAGIIAGILGYLIQEQFAFSVVGVAPLFWLLMGVNTNLLEEVEGANEASIDSHLFRYVGMVTVTLLVLVGVLFSFRLAAADFYYQKAIRASRTGSQYESLDFFRRAALLNPWEVRYLFAYGERAKNTALGDRQLFVLDEAISIYQKGLTRYPTDYDLYFGLGNVQFVKAYLNGERDYSPARRSYAQALKFEPYFVEAYVWLAKTYLAQGEVEPALPYLEKAVSISPQNVAALDALAEAYSKKGENDRAISYLKQILIIDPYYQPALKEMELLKGVSAK